MRHYLMGLAAAALAAVATSTPASAGCGGCAPYGYSPSYSGCAQPVYSPCGSWGGGWHYGRLPEQRRYYAAQPQYYYVDRGPTYTGPGLFAPAPSYQQRAVAGWSGYSQGYYGYTGGPYAHPSHHYYHGMPAVSGPVVYSYRRAYRSGVRYATHRSYAPRYGYAPRAVGARSSVRYGHRHHYQSPRYSVAPHQYGHRQQRGPHRYR
ncbi:hypothetical protein X566_23235 [Afipia sp. P52-10]|uniref:hypothetical protein n=1 Tax=Afipia sp. P52-10 TaxID=1429916 RepID=UPI0003DEF9B5|nr:hypothetical protein [Afipia sp. P52-10]ETR75604.1 hypothetical protein X566_23235 [Afipia sp. P52-10]